MTKSELIKKSKEVINYYDFATKGEKEEINRLLLSSNNLSEKQIKRINKLSLKYRRLKYSIKKTQGSV